MQVIPADTQVFVRVIVGSSNRPETTGTWSWQEVPEPSGIQFLSFKQYRSRLLDALESVGPDY